jgi:hypothetical protein
LHRLPDDAWQQDERRPGKSAGPRFEDPLRAVRTLLQPPPGVHERPPGGRHRERREPHDVGADELDAPRPHRCTIGIDADHTRAAITVVGRERRHRHAQRERQQVDDDRVDDRRERRRPVEAARHIDGLSLHDASHERSSSAGWAARHW